jgi:hypothetical protein
MGTPLTYKLWDLFFPNKSIKIKFLFYFSTQQMNAIPRLSFVDPLAEVSTRLCENRLLGVDSGPSRRRDLNLPAALG